MLPVAKTRQHQSYLQSPHCFHLHEFTTKSILNYGIIQNPQFKLCYNTYEMAKYIVLCLTGLIETLQIHNDETFVVYFIARMFLT